MLRQALLVFLTGAILWALPGFAQQPLVPPKLFSPYTAETFHELGCALYSSPDANAVDCGVALIFFGVAVELDEKTQYVLPDIIKLTSRFPDKDYSNAAYFALNRYVDEESDIQVARLAVRYLLEGFDSREQREGFLGNLLGQLGNKNNILASELSTQLALLVAEKADLAATGSLLSQAYRANPYNKLAFAKLDELTAEPFFNAVYLRHLRFAMRENPFSLENCLGFAEAAESLGLYELAAKTYRYAADLFTYLYPLQPLSASIYLPWAISCYNSPMTRNKCLEIASRVRRTGRFDVLLEAVAAQAALKLGLPDQAERIFKAVEDTAARAVAANSSAKIANAEEFAWFYGFARPDPQKALDWANKAYVAAPDSSCVNAVLAYALMMNQQPRLARPLITNSYKNNQIAAIVMGLIELEQQNKGRAIELFKSAIAMDPGSLEAEHAGRLLQQNGSEYISPLDPEVGLEMLKNEFGNSIVSKFAPAAEMFTVRLAADSGTTFSYGSKITAGLTIYNNSSEPLIISDDGLFKGNIRVDAEVTGDLSLTIPNLIAIRVQPSLPVEPGRSTVIPLRLLGGLLRETLLKSPQAELQLNLTAYLDPIVAADGSVRNAVADIAPAGLVLRRSGVRPTGRFLQSRLDYLSKGNPAQKIRSVNLCVGLLLEHQAMAEGGSSYPLITQEPALLKSALLRGFTDQDWAVKFHSMAAIVDLPLDYGLINGVAANLYDDNWPVRMMAVFLLAKSQGPDFKKVLDSIASADDNPYVRQMALALGADVPEQQATPAGQTPQTATQPPSAAGVK